MNQVEYINRIEEKYNSPYIQIPRNLVTELGYTFKNHNLKRYIDYGFSFLMTNAFLYKYAHYIDIDEGDYLTLSDIKMLLKYSPRNTNINKVSKRKGGILEYEAIVEVTSDVPISIRYSKKNTEGFNTRKILRLSEASYHVADEVKYNILRTPQHYVYIPEFMIDYPLKSGTMNDYRNTVKLSYTEYKYFICNDDMTLKDFLVYFFIKSTVGESGYAFITYTRAQKNTGMGHVTFKKVINKLEDMNIIDVKEEFNIGRYQRRPKEYSITDNFKKLMSK